MELKQLQKYEATMKSCLSESTLTSPKRIVMRKIVSSEVSVDSEIVILQGTLALYVFICIDRCLFFHHFQPGGDDPLLFHLKQSITVLFSIRISELSIRYFSLKKFKKVVAVVNQRRLVRVW